MHFCSGLGVVALITAASGTGSADSVSRKTDLSASNEVLPTSAGKGSLDATHNTATK
jgi:hypothetical protein